MSNLKMKQHHYDWILEHMRTRVLELGPQRLVDYAAMLRTAAEVKDTNKRMRWDLFHVAVPNKADLYRDLYEYLDDSHIDSALRAVMADLGINNL